MILPSKKILYSGTITGLRISAVDTVAFLDACAALVPYADGESDAYIYDSVGAFLKATLKAQGSGETLSDPLITNGDFTLDASWNKEAGWTIHDNAAYHDSTTGTRFLYQTSNITAGWLIKQSVDVNHTAGILFVGVGSGGVTAEGKTYTGSASGDVYYFTATANRSQALNLSSGVVAFQGNMTNLVRNQQTAPSTSGVTLQASKWDATESFGVKATGFKYNQASYAVRVYKAR